MTKRFQQWTTRMVRLCVFPVTWLAGVAAVLSPAAQDSASAQVIATPEGAGTIVTESGDQVDIAGGTQAGGNLFHEFEQFDLSASQTANFTSDSGVFNIVGQISEAAPSYIDGTVQVSGSDANLYLVNPSGVLFGPDAQLALGGSFTATSADQIEFDGHVLNALEPTNDYRDLTGDPSALHFTAESGGAVVNQGDLAVSAGESIALVGGTVVNTGSLEAPGGEVGLVAVGGNSTVTLATPGSLLSMEVAENELLVGADGAWNPTDLPELLTGSPVAGADSLIVNADGTVTLGAAEGLDDATTDSLAENISGADVAVTAGSVVASGEISVASETANETASGIASETASETASESERVDSDGGTVVLLGESVTLAGARVDASGDRGGTIRVGGDLQGEGALPTAAHTLVDADSSLRADGVTGAGGDIVVWADDTATLQGSLSAQGATAGGFVETSAHYLDANEAEVNVSGQTAGGTWLVDPVDFEVVSSGAGVNQVNASTIESVIDAGNNYVVSTSAAGAEAGDISLQTSINQTVATSNGSLRFTGRRFEDNGHSINLASAGSLTFDLNAINPEANPDSSSIQNAVDAIGAVTGQRTIRLGAGDYSFGQRILLDKDVSIEGADPLTTVLSTSTPGARIFRVEPNTEVSLRNLTVTTSGLLPGDLGGGIVNQGVLTVDNSIFEDNRSSHNGGAIDSFNGGPLTVLNSTFRNNRTGANSSGGAIHLGGLSGTSLIRNTVFERNTAVTHGGAVRVFDTTVLIDGGTRFDDNTALNGGALSVEGLGRTEIDSVSFEGNVASNIGGAIMAQVGATVEIEGSLIRNNEAVVSGGGLSLSSGNYAINNSTVVSNEAASGGGAYLNSGSVLDIDETDFTDNIAEAGGGIYAVNSTVNTFSGTRFVRNEATQRDGGGLALLRSQAQISSTTFSLNAATQDDGGAIFAQGGTTLTVNNNSVFADNKSGDDGGAIYVSGGSTATVDTVDVRDNEAMDGGGGVYVSSFGDESEVTLIDVNVLRNTARVGGGLQTKNSNVVIQSRSVSSGTPVAGQFSFNSAVARSQPVNGGAAGVTYGGAIAQSGGSLTLSNVRLARNDSEGAGGGVYVEGSATTIVNDDTEYSRNTAATNGGAIALTGTSALSIDTTFISNNSAGAAGGALYTDSTAAVTIDSTLLQSNQAGTDGGALSLGGGGNTTLSTFSLLTNVAQGDGGAVHLRSDSGNLVMDSASLVRNRAEGVGGAIANFSDVAAFTLTNARLDNNSAGGHGGAVYTQSDSLSSITAASVDQNQAGVDVNGDPLTSRDGGAIYVTGEAGLALERLSLAANTATGQGGAIYYAGDRSLVVNSADLDGNTAQSDGGAIANYASTGTLTVADTSLNNNISQGSGGAIFATNDSTTNSTNNRFTGNRAEGSNSQGGAVAATNGATVTLTDDVVSNNYARQDGGGLFLGDRSSATVTGTFSTDTNGALTTSTTRFMNNESSQRGGGISAFGAGSLAVREVLFQENIAATDGGGIRLASGTATVDLSQFNENTARFGAGIEISDGGKVTVNDSSFTQNQAGFSGGGIQNDDGGALVVSGSTFEQNEAVVGGAIVNSSESHVSNTTLSRNVASDGGGAIRSYRNSQLQLTSSTVVNNHATNRGGGIDATDADVRVQNTIVAANTSAASVDVQGDFTDEGHNLIGQAEGATGFNNSLLVGSAANPIDPKLATLAHNGGPTKTHLLLADSVAIDAGSAMSLLATDQRGQLRLSGRATDIGAVELSNTENPNPTVVTPPELPNVPDTTLPFDPTLSTTDFGSLDSLLAVRTEQGLNESNVSVRRLERLFSQSFEDYWDLSAGPDMGLSDVQAVLRRAQEEYKVNSAVIYAIFAPEEPAEEDSSSSILRVESTPQDDDLLNLSVVLPEGELVNYQLPVTRQEAVRQVRYFRTAAADEYDARGYQPLAQQMYQWLLAPIEDDLAAHNIHNLMYALDSGLRTAPIAAMRDYDGFSLERYGISMVPSMGLMQADFPVAVRRSTVAMGVSQFESQEPLPAVPIELAVVDQFVPVSQTVLNESTTIDTLKSIQSLEQPGILHLATHASFDRRSPEDSLIHLWNEPLSMKEFSHLDWKNSDLEMLILSACSTALGSRNSELGFAGLAAAAGVDATVGSLWEVSDVGTLALMSEFYAQLEKTDLRFEALRQAQLALINGDTRIENGNLITSNGEIDLPDEWNLPASATLDHPFFWSAFTMVGNPW